MLICENICVVLTTSFIFHRKNYPARRDVRDYGLRVPTETTTDFHGLGLERTSVVAHEKLFYIMNNIIYPKFGGRTVLPSDL